MMLLLPAALDTHITSPITVIIPAGVHLVNMSVLCSQLASNAPK